MKKVRFNGCEGKYIYSDSPRNLEIGKVYEVVSETNYGWQRNYHLKGVKGEYNSKWFTILAPEDEDKLS